MPRLLINPLSLQQQYHEVVAVYDCVREFMAMLDYVRPAISAQRNTLWFDAQLYQAKLRVGEPFSQTINRLGVPPGNQIQGVRPAPQNQDEADLKKRWFIFIKNHAKPCQQPHAQVTLSTNTAGSVQGAVAGEFCSPAADDAWLGFAGHPVFEQPPLMVQVTNGVQFTITHASHLAQIKQALPRYEYSDKHDRKIDKTGPGGVLISAMPLADEKAQELLLCSLPYGRDFFAFHEKRGEYYRFKPTHPDQNIYHGFRIKEADVPNEISSEILK